jgi:hypothetical protein
MPVVDRRAFGGRFSVAENSRLANYRYLEIQLMATEWARRLTDDERREDLVRWGTEAVARIESFYATDGYSGPGEVAFTFVKGGGARAESRASAVIGE